MVTASQCMKASSGAFDATVWTKVVLKPGE
jgi:hypothetical protein